MRGHHGSDFFHRQQVPKSQNGDIDSPVSGWIVQCNLQGRTQPVPGPTAAPKPRDSLQGKPNSGRIEAPSAATMEIRRGTREKVQHARSRRDGPGEIGEAFVSGAGRAGLRSRSTKCDSASFGLLICRRKGSRPVIKKAPSSPRILVIESQPGIREPFPVLVPSRLPKELRKFRLTEKPGKCYSDNGMNNPYPDQAP